MIPLGHEIFLIESADELPCLPTRIGTLFADIETSSGNPLLDSLNPWRHCKYHLAAVTWDDHPSIYVTKFAPFFIDALHRSEYWCNQNVKYDAHVTHNDLKYTYTGKYLDTLTLAKLVDSDRTYKGGYGLDQIAKWLSDIDMSFWVNPVYGQISPKQKDFGNVQLNPLAKYCGNDVRLTRMAYHELLKRLPEECSKVWETEQRLTSTLITMERRGMKIDVEGTKRAQLRSVYRMMLHRQAIEKLLGEEFDPGSHNQVEDLLLTRFGLPPVYSEKKGVKSKGPSFDKKVLKDYKLLPYAPVEIIELLEKYRHEQTINSLYWETWLDLHIDGILHSDNNQCVRSGRMSCSQPNNQQFNNEARELIIAREGHSLVVHDYSQTEYRLIIHYIENQRIIDIFAANPETDFHQLMADDAGIHRKSAKILNLAMGYGMGKKKTTADLCRDPGLIEATKGDIFDARMLATRIHADFHTRLPELRPETKKAENAARRHGYVRNARGRRCHIELQPAHTAFNRVCQSHAADLIKERANVLDDHREMFDAHLLALVHDEVVSELPTELAERYAEYATGILNDSSVSLRVPIRCDCGVSDKSWLAAKS